LKTAKHNNDTVTLTQNGGRWLVRLGLADLVFGMTVLSEEYKMDWAASWNDHMDDPDWLRRAMANTFVQLKPADKDLIRPLYDDWLWYEKNFDMKALIVPEYNALCYVLDGEGKRVRRMDGPVTVLRGLKGRTGGKHWQPWTSGVMSFAAGGSRGAAKGGGGDKKDRGGNRLPSSLFGFDQVGQHLVDVVEAVIVAIDLI